MRRVLQPVVVVAVALVALSLPRIAAAVLLPAALALLRFSREEEEARGSGSIHGRYIDPSGFLEHGMLYI